MLAALAATPAFDANIPDPAAALGYPPGERPAPPAEIVAYFEELAAATPRAQLRIMGETHEGRPLIVLAISSEENMARAQKVSETLQRASDPRKVGSDAQARAAIADLPAIAWLGYSIHGNEVSGADASMLVAYRLAAGTDEQTKKWRDNVITYVDPLQNPDGRQRAIATFESARSAVPDLDAGSLPNSEMWPYGRGNHYLFDLNRDWFALVHPESRARVPLIADLLPQLQVDAHEMGHDSSFLFSPARAPYNPHRPASLPRWERRFSQDQARAFDAQGWSYYTREWNEEFFAGYGSSWSMYLGAIGILYEQAGSMGTTVRQRAGTLLTYPEAVARQATSSFANIDTLATERKAIMRDWLKSRRDAARLGGPAPVRAYVIRGDKYPDRVRALTETLLMLNIEVARADKPVSVPGANGFYGRAGTVRLPAGALRIRLDQPNARLIRNLLDFHLPMGAAFLREQRQWLEQGKGSRLYETTAWSVAHAYGLEAYWTREIQGRWTPLSAPDAVESAVVGEAGYGWLIDGTTDAAVQVAGRLLERGVKLRVTREPTSIEDRSYPKGTILIKKEGNPDDVAGTVETIARLLGVEVVGVKTGLATRGTDLGGDNFEPIVAPRVAMIAGDPVRVDAYGFIWHLLDQRAGIRLSRLNIAWLAFADLRRYNVLIVPSSWNMEAYRARLGPAALKNIEGWVKAGGTLIAVGNGAEVIAAPETKMTTTRFRRHLLEQYPPVVFGLDPDVAVKAGRFRAVGLRASPKVDKKKGPAPSAGWSDARRPYHVPPVLGAGARLFATSSPPPFRWPKQRRTLDAWAARLGPADAKAKKAFIEKADARLRRFSPSGVYLGANVDDDHWLTYGIEPNLPVYFAARDALLADGPSEVPVRLEDVDRLHLGGLLWPEAAGRLAKTAYLVREQVGRGQVILFASDPAFRGVAFGTQRLLLNAVVYGPGLGTSWPRPW